MARTRQLSDLAVALAGWGGALQFATLGTETLSTIQARLQMCVNGLTFYIRSVARDEKWL